MKTCPQCKQSKPYNAFHSNKSKLDGLAFYCRECNNLKLAESRDKRKDTTDYVTRARSYRDTYRTTNPEGVLFSRCKYRAENKSISFTISKEDIHIPDNCPVCDCLLEVGKEVAHEASPSVDRYDPNLGYIPGNIWIICNRCNRCKQDMSGEDHIAFGWKLIDAFKEAYVKL